MKHLLAFLLILSFAGNPVFGQKTHLTRTYVGGESLEGSLWTKEYTYQPKEDRFRLSRVNVKRNDNTLEYSLDLLQSQFRADFTFYAADSDSVIDCSVLHMAVDNDPVYLGDSIEEYHIPGDEFFTAYLDNHSRSYQDTVKFLGYDRNYDYTILIGEKNGEYYSASLMGIDESVLSIGDTVALRSGICCYQEPGDGSIFYVKDMVLEAEVLYHHPFGYEEFKSLFVSGLGEQYIPFNPFTKFLFATDHPEREVLFAEEMMEEINGCDFFVVHHIIPPVGEESKIEQDTYLIFKDGKLTHPFDSKTTQNVLGIYIEGEGGIFEQSYEIAEDNTIIRNYEHSECCLSTGFKMPVKSRSSTRSYISSSGELCLKEITTAEFSSGFFYPIPLDEIKNDPEFSYPGREDKYELILGHYQHVPFYEKGIRLFFYLEKDNDVLIPTFITQDKDGNRIDTFSFDSNTSKIASASDRGNFSDPLFLGPIKIWLRRTPLLVGAEGYFYM